MNDTNLNTHTISRSKIQDVKTVRAVLSYLDIIIKNNMNNLSKLPPRADVFSCLVSINSYNDMSLKCKKTCQNFRLVSKVKFILRLYNFATDIDLSCKCIQVLISMFPMGDDDDKNERAVQNIMFKENITGTVIQVLQVNTESSSLARYCMIFFFRTCRNDAAKAKILRKQGCLELIKRTISVHAKNRVSGLLVLQPAKQALESVWYGAKKQKNNMK